MANARPKLEVGLERVLFASRWILAPFYLGMAVALAIILVVFVHELVTELAHVPTMDAEQGIVLALSLIDLSLTGNLLLIVIFSGYENFASLHTEIEGSVVMIHVEPEGKARPGGGFVV